MPILRKNAKKVAEEDFKKLSGVYTPTTNADGTYSLVNKETGGTYQGKEPYGGVDVEGGDLRKRRQQKLMGQKMSALIEKPDPLAGTRDLGKSKVMLDPGTEFTAIQTGKPNAATSSLVPRAVSNWKITGKYIGMEPLITALQDSSITSEDARLAVLAQKALETGYGKNVHDYNYGNVIKGSSWTGPTRRRGDHDAKGNPITQEFRVYTNATESLSDYLQTLKTMYPDSYNELHRPDFDLNRFTKGLSRNNYRYAEDPAYENKITDVYNAVRRDLLGA